MIIFEERIDTNGQTNVSHVYLTFIWSGQLFVLTCISSPCCEGKGKTLEQWSSTPLEITLKQKWLIEKMVTAKKKDWIMLSSLSWHRPVGLDQLRPIFSMLPTDKALIVSVLSVSSGVSQLLMRNLIVVALGGSRHSMHFILAENTIPGYLYNPYIQQKKNI